VDSGTAREASVSRATDIANCAFFCNSVDSDIVI
jgi:hypothetical protein